METQAQAQTQEMSQPAVKVIKSIDVARRSRAIVTSVSDRECWLDMRNLLLQQLALIEKRLGVSRRCRNCGEDVSAR